jgi:sialidase-1
MKKLTILLAMLFLAILLTTACEASNKDVTLNPKCSWLPFDKNSWITQLNNGDLMALDVDQITTSSDNGKTWSEPIKADPAPGTSMHWLAECRNLIQTKNGALICIYEDLKSEKWLWDSNEKKALPGTKLDVWAMRSLDGGKTWTDKTKILDGYCGALIDIKQLSSGEVVATVMDMFYDLGRHYSFTVVSNDDGKTWKRGNNLDLGGRGDHDGAVEPTFVERKDGSILMFIRTNLDQFWVAYSYDKGLYWREMKPSGVDGSSSPGFLLRLASGKIAFVWNRLYPEGKTTVNRSQPNSNTSETAASWQRSELSIAFSSDEGKSWSQPVVIAKHKSGQLAYPYMLERKPGEIWVILRAPSGGPACFSLLEKDFVRKTKLKLMK